MIIVPVISRLFSNTELQIKSIKLNTAPTLTYEELTEDYPRYPDVWDLVISDLGTDAIVDISEYCNRCPYTVYPESPVPQVFSLFRSMGLRHLPVVDHEGKLQGIITRHNLTHEYLEGRLHSHHQQQQGQRLRRLAH